MLTAKEKQQIKDFKKKFIEKLWEQYGPAKPFTQDNVSDFIWSLGGPGQAVIPIVLFQYKIPYGNKLDITVLNKYFNILRKKAKAIHDKNQKLLKNIKKAPESAPFERIAFGDARHLPEPDTKIEYYVYDKLKDHFIGEAVPEKAAKTVSDVLKSGYYTDIFKKPSVGTVYRGIGVKRNVLEKLIGKDPGSAGYAETGKKYRSKRSQMTSWTKDPGVAYEFAYENRDDEGSYLVVFVASTADNKNKFLDAKGLYELERFEGFKREKEIVGLGDIQANAVYWIALSMFDKISEPGLRRYAASKKRQRKTDPNIEKAIKFFGKIV